MRGNDYKMVVGVIWDLKISMSKKTLLHECYVEGEFVWFFFMIVFHTSLTYITYINYAIEFSIHFMLIFYHFFNNRHQTKF